MGGTKTLLDHLSNVNDPRIERTKKHLLVDVLTIGVVGVLCGADGWDEIVFVATEKEEWLRSFLELPNGIPSADTISRVFARVNPKEFSRIFTSWILDVVQLTKSEVIAIDGKTLRASHDGKSNKSAIHMVSAWASENGVVLGQIKVDEKSNEITAIPQLLELLTIKGCIVTIDAMGCQKEIAQSILDADADYVLCVKDNQAGTKEVIEQHFDTKMVRDQNELTTVDNDHGRLETRRYQVADARKIEELSIWPGCQSIAKVESTREMNGEKSYEVRYFILSFRPDVKKSANAIRSHWKVENCLHWVLDVAFDEDRSRIRKEQAPENVATLRHTALNLLKSEKSLKTSVNKKRLKCAMSNEYLAKVLRGGK